MLRVKEYACTSKDVTSYPVTSNSWTLVYKNKSFYFCKKIYITDDTDNMLSVAGSWCDNTLSVAAT